MSEKILENPQVGFNLFVSFLLIHYRKLRIEGQRNIPYVMRAVSAEKGLVVMYCHEPMVVQCVMYKDRWL